MARLTYQQTSVIYETLTDLNSGLVYSKNIPIHGKKMKTSVDELFSFIKLSIAKDLLLFSLPYLFVSLSSFSFA